MENDGYILLVEDERKLQENLNKLLRRRGYDTCQAYTINEAWEHIKREIPRAIVLDVKLPDGNGFDFLEELRETLNVPVLLLTSLNTRGDLLRGLQSGGDTYLTKPFDTMVFLCHLEALLRRSEFLPVAFFYGPLRLESSSAKAFLNGEDMLLSYKEFSLLQLFTQNPDKVLSPEFLFEKVWGCDIGNNTHSLRKALSRLRSKLEKSGYTINSVRNEGYIFELKLGN